LGGDAVKIFIHSSADNVAVALADLKPGETVKFRVDGESREVKVRDEIPYGRLQFGEDLDITFDTLIGTGCNPNVAATLVVGLEPEWTERQIELRD